YLDRAFSTGVGRLSRAGLPKKAGSGEPAYEGVKWLRAAPFLLTPAAAQHLHANRVQGFGSITEQQLRDFPIVPAQLGPTLRFVHAPAILTQFQVYAGSYRPNKLGTLPAVFKDIATLDDYRTLHLDAFGMAEEVKVLERHLLERGIVCIVDTTNFHPELGAVVADEKIK